MSQVLDRFKSHLAVMDAYNHAAGILNYDSVTSMPAGGFDHVGKTMGVLSEALYKLTVDPQFNEDIEYILSDREEFDRITVREAEELHESAERTAKIPMEEYVAYQVELNDASGVWHEAKLKNDFAAFAPHLEKLASYNRRFAGYWDSTKPVYDVLLDQYEKGLRKTVLDGFFKNLEDTLSPLVKEIGAAAPVEDGFAKQYFPLEKQRLLSDYLMQLLTIDRRHCNIGETEHPFTTNFTKDDVRITTHYHETDFMSSMFSVIHEGGHALYELNVGDDLRTSPLGTGASMSIHESQSRFYENIIGRSEAFLSVLLPKLRELMPGTFENVSARELYRAANKSVPSLIRTEADELTYPFHIMVRYDIEKMLLEEGLPVKDVPGEWARLYKRYLGITVPNDREGCLQDSHWSGGLFGYFPSYALGSAYGAQMLHTMKEQMDVDGCVASADLHPIVSYLTDKIYRHGCLLRPNELILNACGAPFDPKYFTEYLYTKYKDIYSL